MHLSLHLATQTWPVSGSNRYGACASLFVAHLHCYIIPVIRQYPKLVGEPGVKPRFAASDAAVLFNYTTHPPGTRAGNPTRISSLGPKRHHALGHASKNWKGCRELNSNLKVRSLAPSIRWTTSPVVGRRCRTRTDIQSLEGSVLILLNEAPSRKWWVTLGSNQPGLA